MDAELGAQVRHQSLLSVHTGPGCRTVHDTDLVRHASKRRLLGRRPTLPAIGTLAEDGLTYALTPRSDQRREARIAGYQPKNTPTRPENATASPADWGSTLRPDRCAREMS
jgi:hypothetical protein